MEQPRFNKRGCSIFSKSSIMKIIFLALTIASTLCAQTTIAVLEFEGRSISKDEALTLTDRFRNEIIKTNKYIVVERGAMKEILEEHISEIRLLHSSV